jgi:hypothetical protein
MSYTVAQLVKYLRYCNANPTARVLPPGGRVGFDDMTAAQWLSWFRRCLMDKINREDRRTGRKHSEDWQRETRRLAARVNSRLIVRPRDVPAEYRDRLSHRITDD